MEALQDRAVQDFSKQEHMSSDAYRHYVAWRDILLERIRNRGELLLVNSPDRFREHQAINRQVALAVISDLEYNFRKRKQDIHQLTGKSAVHWNFQILGTTLKDGQVKVRIEQKTSDFFIASVLNHLKAAGVELDWKKLGFYLEAARWRVIAEPAEKGKMEQWRQQCGGECVEPGLNYPAPWHVSNWAGDHKPGTEDLLILEWSGYKRTTLNPGRIKRLDIACFLGEGIERVTDEDSFTRRPSILKGMGRRDLKRVDDPVGADLEKMLQRGMRKMNAMLEQEEQRRRAAEERVRGLESDVFFLEAKVASLEKEKEQMMERGQKYAEVLNQINKLSWIKGIK